MIRHTLSVNGVVMVAIEGVAGVPIQWAAHPATGPIVVNKTDSITATGSPRIDFTENGDGKAYIHTVTWEASYHTSATAIIDTYARDLAARHPA